ncbi:hypothetical protein [Azorhizobium doebereinerae]|uniref:hypothetical protein n=1 Tax=Azorhizobium doebereinerae TaxID=281091 RepID=UPI0004124B95|nr:hypothetical protein [Azorhizobium doebereinerae]
MRRIGLVLGLMMVPALASAQQPPAAPAPAAPPVDAAPSSEARGRFSFAPVDGGALKLDTQTGMVSFCSKGSGGFACVAVPDSRDAYEAEIARLQAQLDGRGPAKAYGNTLSVPLPSQSDLDAAYSYATRLYQRLRAFVDGTAP